MTSLAVGYLGSGRIDRWMNEFLYVAYAKVATGTFNDNRGSKTVDRYVHVFWEIHHVS